MSIRPGAQDANVPLRLHAELLPNIRQITLYASLPRIPELVGIRPAIQLSDSRKEATVSLPSPFDHVSETIKLPARVSDAYQRLVNARTGAAVTPVSTQSTDTSQDYSFRMQVDSSDEDLLLPRDELIDDYVPWTAADMSLSTRICCQRCGNTFLKTKTSSSKTEDNVGQPEGWIWKDLPSGNWAEMMDFWHCHKPDPHEDDQDGTKSTALGIEDQTAQLKGYGAASRVVAIPGTVLIDTATFLLVESDCRGLKKGNKEEASSTIRPFENITLQCEKCDSIIGIEDQTVNGWRLLKAFVGLTINPSHGWESHCTDKIVAAQLLELVERESARRFIVHCGQREGLLLWVFNPDMRYSNPLNCIVPQQAMKVLFQETEDLDRYLSPELGKVTPLSLEELELPSKVFTDLRDVLKEMNEMLPSSTRKFNEWQVGLLHRFKRDSAV